jgi:hypothetical protein
MEIIKSLFLVDEPYSWDVITKYSTNISRVPQCLSPRPNWVPPPTLPQAGRPFSGTKGGGGHTHPRMRGEGSQFERVEKRPSTLRTLFVCGCDCQPRIQSVSHLLFPCEPFFVELKSLNLCFQAQGRATGSCVGWSCQCNSA